LFLYAFDPTVIAHSYLVTTDVGMAAFTVLFLFMLWRYIQKPSRLRLVWCGLALGAVLGSKFSAVALLPVGAILLLAGMWRHSQPAKPVAPNSPCPCGSGRKYKVCHGLGPLPNPKGVGTPRPRIAVRAGFAFLVMLGIAALVIEALYFFSSDPFLYLTGLARVNADHAADYPSYLHGVLEPGGDPSYFVIAYLLKEPLAIVVLAVIGWLVLLRNKSMPLVSKLFLLLPPAVLLAAYTIGADQWGVRYIIPTLPFAFLAGGIGLAALVRTRSIWARAAAATLCVWTVAEAAAIYPDHLSYFNEMACALERPTQIGLDGGTRCGPLWLDDSNVDWGQGLKQLRRWLDAHPDPRTIKLFYFGSLPPNVYGLKYTSLKYPELLAEPEPGLYVVSAHAVARAPVQGAAWLRDLQPIAIVGHALYVYDVPAKP
jgi:hypothetical protein